jgi:hypothetical protein
MEGENVAVTFGSPTHKCSVCWRPQQPDALNVADHGQTTFGRPRLIFSFVQQANVFSMLEATAKLRRDQQWAPGGMVGRSQVGTLARQKAKEERYQRWP